MTQQTATNDDLYLKFLGSLIEELGAKMYPSITASVAELISNAWDADAKNVWVNMPLGKSVRVGDDEIVVIDDGDGMSRTEARNKYLVVGRKRRQEENKTTSSSGRPLHGRKGVGKLAAFGTAMVLECTTRSQASEVTAFRLDYDKIRECPGGYSYKVPEIEKPDPLLRPDNGDSLKHGTRVRLRDLRAKIIPAVEQFTLSLARRFGVLSPEMNVFLNGERITRFDIPVQISFPRDGVPTPGHGLPRKDPDTGREPEPIKVIQDYAVEHLPGGKEVRWWIGFTAKPIEMAEFRGIAILAHRKMVQRPFMFGRSQGTAGQLGQEYLVGEVIADWIDDTITSEDDLIETNRNELQLEDERLQQFLEWGRRRLRWALGRRNDLRVEKLVSGIDVDPEIQERLGKFTRREQVVFKAIGQRLAKLPETQPSDVSDLMMQTMDAYDDVAIREIIERISQEDESTQERMWGLVAEFGLIDARRAMTKIRARLEVIDKLAQMVKGGFLEVPDIHDHIVKNPWLLDPRWDLYDDEVDLTKALRDKFGLVPDAKGKFVDYLFTLSPSTPTFADQVIVVEIKRGTKPNGSPYHVTGDEVQRFATYVGYAEEHYGAADSPSSVPNVRGLMIASGYTQGAQIQRRSTYEAVQGGKYQFKSWESVLKDTRRLHVGWLELSTRRAKATS